MSRTRYHTGIAAAALLAALALEAGAEPALGDPTRPTALISAAAAAAAAAPAGPRWRLQSTLVADDRRLAVINGRTVSRGDRVDGAQVVEIGDGGVTLELAGRRLQLHVVPPAIDVKRPSS